MCLQSLPYIAPIVIAPGVTLVPKPDRPVIGGDVDRIWVDAGKHEEDGGRVTLMNEGDHKILFCEHCRTNVPIPLSVFTYAGLRTNFADLNEVKEVSGMAQADSIPKEWRDVHDQDRHEYALALPEKERRQFINAWAMGRLDQPLEKKPSLTPAQDGLSSIHRHRAHSIGLDVEP